MSHADVIHLWPSVADFGSDIGVAYETAKAMRRRGSIPAPYWRRVVYAASERGLEGVTLDRLADLVAIPEAAE